MNAIEAPEAPDSTTSQSSQRRIEELGRVILVYSDITEKLQLSHERLQRTVSTLRNELSEKSRLLERRQRLAALGEMAAGMAHEIRNPLGGIRLYASLLMKDLEDRPEARATVEKIVAGVRGLDNVVTQVLAFTRELRPQIGEIDLRQVVDLAIGLAAPVLGEIDVRVNGPQRLVVQADGDLLGQAILNLIRNAAEAMQGCGQVTVTCETSGAGKAGPAGQTGQTDQGQFNLMIEDTGPGIAPEVLDRIFNPFFTTRDQGTGLGLAIVHRIVEAHDGSITAANREPRGARFEIRI